MSIPSNVIPSHIVADDPTGFDLDGLLLQLTESVDLEAITRELWDGVDLDGILGELAEQNPIL